MRKILIVGAGQSGLHLAHGLLSNGYDVTLITGKTSTELRTGRPSITQLTFPTVLEYERELGLDFWSADVPRIEQIKLHGYPPGSASRVIDFSGRLSGHAVSVDRRVKMADWLEYFEDRGGKVVIHGVTVTDLDYFARMFDLVVVAVGHGELGGLFDPDPGRFGEPRARVLAQAHLDDVEPDPDDGDEVGWAGITADAGSVILMPILTAQGPCHSLFIVEKRGGLIDSWPDRMTPEEQWNRMRDLLRDHVPEYYERVRGASLAEGRSVMRESVDLQVRHPVGVLPSGGRVIGIADVVITSDPFSVQGWNHSSRCAKSYLESILARGDGPFDEAFLLDMFERYWEYGYPAEVWADACATFWERTPPPHFQEIFGAMAQYPEIADRWVAGWDYPPDYQNWLFDPDLARKYLAEVAGAHASSP